MSLFRLLILPLILLVGSCATVPPAPQPGAQEQGFVIAANPLAARAGMEVLERGGSAIDAAIAVQAMLSLVEPQSSGLGGGAFLNYYDAGSRKLTIYDGRERAPAQATPGMFLDGEGKPLPFPTAPADDILDLRLGATAGSLVLELTDEAPLFRTQGRVRGGEAVKARRLAFSPRQPDALLAEAATRKRPRGSVL